MNIIYILHVFTYLYLNIFIVNLISLYLWMDEWVGGWVDGRIDECLRVWINGRMNRCMGRWRYVDALMRECMGECVDGWVG